MNTNRDHLDESIDHVVSRMTNVTEDEGLALRIAQALPERSPWLPYGWLPRFAVGALATLAIIVVLRTFDDRSTGVGPAEAGHHSVSAAPAEVGPAEAGHHRVTVGSAFRRTGSGTIVDRPDHAFSLPAIEATAALGIDALAPASLPEDAPLTIESLEIADLPLTADFSPR